MRLRRKGLVFLVALGLLGLVICRELSWNSITKNPALEAGGAERSALVSPAFAARNQPPIADAGPDQTAAIDDIFLLGGSGSYDPDGKRVSHSWSLNWAPADSIESLSDPNAAQPSFQLDLPGDYVFELIVLTAWVGS